MNDPLHLAAALKDLPLTLTAPRPLDEAISTAGAEHAGEMLDWEAPTGGYLLTACLATGRAAGQGVMDWWAHQPRP
jgi:predicted flavoprotein YhiN